MAVTPEFESASQKYARMSDEHLVLHIAHEAGQQSGATSALLWHIADRLQRRVLAETAHNEGMRVMKAMDERAKTTAETEKSE